MDGLSADKLRVLLHPVPEQREEKSAENDEDDGNKKNDRNRDRDDNRRDRDKTAEELSKEEFELNFKHNQVLASLQDGTRGQWKTAQVMYSFPLPHKVE